MRLNALLHAAMLLILSAGAGQAASTITTLGRHPFHQPPLQSADDLKAMMREHQDEIKEGLDKTGSKSAQLYNLLEKQFPLAEIKEMQYKPGATFLWMFFKRNGKGNVKVVRDLTWGGKEPFDGYEFLLTDKEKCQSYTVTVPKICGNVALLKTEQLKDCSSGVCADCPKECPAECRLDPHDSEKCPVECKNCRVECLPEFTCYDFPLDCPAVCLDDLEKCPAECKGVPEACITACPDSDCPPVTCADCPPDCALHPDYCPDECKLLDCPVSPVVKEPVKEPSLPVHFVADLGYFKQTDPADYVFGRIGVEYSPFASDSDFENISFLGMIGVAPQVKGDDGDDVLLLDMFANYNWTAGDMKGWIGLGVGGWITSGDVDDDSGDTDIDIMANVGARVYGDPSAFNVSAFLEIRSAVDEFDGLAEYGRFGVGLRCRF
ncbi:hypothetical protein [Candidatus Electronema sp. PJ]|uniref:hypothetical protein n=1 Tax=Candidatus Electronema sp. PJ TaxID=3401572 RepID=UPI003AA81E32